MYCRLVGILVNSKLHNSITGIPYIKRNYACKHCGKCFRSPADVTIHEAVHTKVKAFNCDMCNAQFTQKASLKDHYNVHLKTFQCEHCKKAFGRQRYLINHIKSCAGGRPVSKFVKNEESIGKSKAVVLKLFCEITFFSIFQIQMTICNFQ